MSNIQKNINNHFDLKLLGCNYWDFYLSMDKQTDCFNCNVLITGDVIAQFDFNNLERICSDNFKWSDATSFDGDICDIGLNGYDNRFVDAWTGETFNPSGDTTFCLPRVSGDVYCYEMEYIPAYGVEPEHIQFCGGFFQGFYRLHGYEYNVLPNFYQFGWTKEFWLKKSNCPTGETVIVTGETTEIVNISGEDIIITEIWETEVTQKSTCPDKYQLNEVYPDNKGIFYFWGTRAENKFCMFPAISGLTTCTGIPLATPVTEEAFQPSGNSFLYYTRRNVFCSTGSTNSTGDFSDCCEGVINNAMGFRVTDEGEIGVRILTTTGECKLVGESIMFSGTPIVEEFYSKPGIIEDDKWHHVAYRFKPYETTECIGYRIAFGELSIFVDGFLKVKLDGFPEFIPYELDEHPDKQLGVPFNISIGGGTQGLLESYTFSGLTEGYGLTGYTACNYVTSFVNPCVFNGVIVNGIEFKSPPLSISEPELIETFLEMVIPRRHGQIKLTPYTKGCGQGLKIEVLASLDKLDAVLIGNGVSSWCVTNCINIPPHNGRCGYIEDAFAGSFIGGIADFRLHNRALCLHEIRCNFQLEQQKYNRDREIFNCK